MTVMMHRRILRSGNQTMHITANDKTVHVYNRSEHVPTHTHYTQMNMHTCTQKREYLAILLQVHGPALRLDFAEVLHAPYLCGCDRG